MVKPSKRVTETSRSVSDLVNEVVHNQLLEDKADLEAFRPRSKESAVTYEKMLKNLKRNGSI